MQAVDRADLTDEEWQLVIELLERERQDLPAEIHHTRTADFREQLRRRLEVLDTVIAKLRQIAPC